MNRKNINFDSKKNKIKQLLQQKQKNIDDIDVNKILVSKKGQYGKVNTIHLNTLLGIMIMVLLDHYVENFQK